jgi:NAD(P)-dependent dehydrogenase (short-subunit alcohol dehydrogenase family)
MKNLQGKVAVITGGASGLGRAIADVCAKEKMNIVIADIEDKVLQQTASDLQQMGAQILPVKCDVSKAADVQRLADKTYETFGACHLLFNNAGVAGGKRAWETTEADWQWELGVNLWGVIHGIRIFVPRMLAQGDECYVINTASVAGLLTPTMSASYNVSKHGVVALTETLYHDLNEVGAKIHAAVLCPAYVNTGIGESSRNRPSDLINQNETISADQQARHELLKQALIKGKKTAADVANDVFAAIAEDKFYILTHPRILPSVQMRFDEILHQRNPTNPMQTK